MKAAIEIFATIFSISIIRYFVIAGIPFLLFYKMLNNGLSKSKIQSKLAVNADFGRDILHSLQSTLVFTIIAYIILFTPIKTITRVYSLNTAYPAWWVWVSVPLSLVIHDTYFYWTHRLLHHKKLFYFTHVLHHRSTNPSPWTSYSFHFFEAWVEGAVLLVIAMILPVNKTSMVAFIIVAFIINVYGHLGFEILPKRFRTSWIFEVFNTSVYHNLHHSKFKGNYGLYFRVWDRLMDTENPDYVKEYDKIQDQRFGESANAKPAN